MEEPPLCVSMGALRACIAQPLICDLGQTRLPRARYLPDSLESLQDDRAYAPAASGG